MKILSPSTCVMIDLRSYMLTRGRPFLLLTLLWMITQSPTSKPAALSMGGAGTAAGGGGCGAICTVLHSVWSSIWCTTWVSCATAHLSCCRMRACLMRRDLSCNMSSGSSSLMWPLEGLVGLALWRAKKRCKCLAGGQKKQKHGVCFAAPESVYAIVYFLLL